MPRTQKTSVTLHLDPNLVNPYLAKVTDNAARRAANVLRERARALAPKHTGALRNSIVARRSSTDVGKQYSSTYTVGPTLKYGVYQEFGTGPIVPVKAKVLRFKPKGSGKFVFAMRTKGVPAVHYMRDTYSSLTLQDFLPRGSNKV